MEYRSDEEENYVRMSLLLTGISPRAVRTLFDYEFAPVCLEASLKKEYNKLFDLKKKRIINQSQWNILFPRFPDVPDSKTFDINLLIILLTNLTPMSPPLCGFDRLPTTMETTKAADLARFKHYRNYLAHLDEGKIDSNYFNTIWNDITSAIERLGGQRMKQECDHMKTKPLDQTNLEIMMDIKHSDNEIRELKESFESLKLSHTEIIKSHELLQENYAVVTKEIEEIKISQNDTVPWNIRARFEEKLKAWRNNDDKMFINTRAAQYVLKCIQENSCVTITASSGVGKTSTLRHTALQLADKEYDVLVVTAPSDIVRFYNPKKKTLFVIDDLCGNFSVDQSDIKNWEPVMEDIQKILDEKQTKILAACRLQVYQDEKFDVLSVFKACVCNMLSESICLSKSEKHSIAKLYLNAKASEISDYYDFYDCFPLLCKLYHGNPELNVTDFFQNPFSVYEAQINSLLKKGYYTKYCALALCVMFNNKINEELLTEKVNEATKTIIENTCEACKLNRGTSRLVLQNELELLTHTFIKKEQNVYKAIHDKIFDFLAYCFGQKIIRCLIKNADNGLIKERFLLEEKDDMDQFVIIIPLKYHQIYIQRMIDEWSKGKVQDVFNNINMKIAQFRQKFLSYLNTLNISYQRQLANICENYKPCKEMSARWWFEDDDNANASYDTALLHFCYIGDMSLIEWCCNHGVDVSRCACNGDSAIIIGSDQGHTELVKMLLNKGVDCDKCDEYNESPVMKACNKGHSEIVKMLLDRGVDYNACDRRGHSPLIMACENGHTEVVTMLLDREVDCNKYIGRLGKSPINRACQHGHTEIVKMLLDKGADYNTHDWKTGQSPIITACKHGHTDIVKMLLDKGADFDKCFRRTGKSPLITACKYGKTKIVKMLLDRGADCNKCDRRTGQSPINTACKHGHIQIVRILLDRGANCNKCDIRTGQLTVLKACELGHTEIGKLLLENRADCNTCDKWGKSPVMRACEHGHTELLKMLLDRGADYNACDWNGKSPVMMACEHGHTEIVKLLLEKGACNEHEKCGESLVMIACKNSHTETVKMLLDKGSDCNKCDFYEDSPLMIACVHAHTEILTMLLDKGADYNKRNRRGQTPLMQADEHGHTEIVQLLLDRGANFNNCDEKDKLPVVIACEHENTEIKNMVLDGKANCNESESLGHFTVKIACEDGHTEMEKMVLDREANCNKRDTLGHSPEKVACEDHGHTEMENVLLKVTAECRKYDSSGKSTEIFDWENSHTETEKLLSDIEANCIKSDSLEHSPVKIACEDGHTEMENVLSKLIAECRKFDSSVKSPEKVNLENSHTESEKLSSDVGADCIKSDSLGLSHLKIASENVRTKIQLRSLDRRADSTYDKRMSQSSLITKVIKHPHTGIVKVNRNRRRGQSPIMKAREYGQSEIE